MVSEVYVYETITNTGSSSWVTRGYPGLLVVPAETVVNPGRKKTFFRDFLDGRVRRV